MDAYKANLDLINNADLTNLDEYAYAMKLTCDYAIFLKNSGHFNKGLLFLDEAIDMMEHFPDYQKKQLFDVPSYELVLFHNARAFYHLKYYNYSKPIFERLMNAFPGNDKYKSWIYRIKVKKYEMGIWTGLGVMLATIILRISFNGRYPLFDQLTYWILLVALIGTVTLVVGKRIELHKLKRINIQ